jgi:dihydroorotate dehydrogenase (NAD+) catalytic subunit
MNSEAAGRRAFLRERFDNTGGGIGFATVSGILTTRPEMIRELDRRIPGLVMITTKSYQLLPNRGNREPIIVESAPGCYGNAVGLKNPGMDAGLKELGELREKHRMRALLNVSLSGSSPEDFVRLAEAFSAVADTLELNFSCPHAAPGYGMSIGVDPELVARYVAAVRDVTGLPVIPKLSPNVDDIGSIARAAMGAGADALAAVNTVGPELYIEPNSGKPVLMNRHGGRGGKSGLWIRETALEKVRQIRDAVGAGVPLIGMGGVGDAASAAAMRDAGADIVGIGSAFAQVMPSDWEAWFEEMGAGTSPCSGRPVQRIEKRQMEYKPFVIASTEAGEGGLRRITLEGELDYEPGQFAFIWIPGVGEKPFSVALSSPLTFLVRSRGPMTSALCACGPGETLYVRGVYGKGAPVSDVPRAWILAGGTGLAVAPKLAESLAAAGKQIVSICALSDSSGGDAPEEAAAEAVLFRDELSACGEYEPVRDRGEIGRAVGYFSERMLREECAGESAVYTIGPFPFMNGVAERAAEAGVPASRIHISIETPTRCGAGLCGECVCAGRLTCREGTFFTLKELEERGVSLMECAHDS